MTRITCTHCGAKTPKKAKFCSACGEASQHVQRKHNYLPLIAASLGTLLLAFVVLGVPEAEAVDQDPPQKHWTHPEVGASRSGDWKHPDLPRTPVSNHPDMAEIDRLLRVAGSGEASALAQVHAILDRLLQGHPNFGYGLRLKANLYRTKGNFADAIPLFERYLELKPEDARGRESYALCLLETGDTQSALEQLQKIHKDFPQHVAVLKHLSKVFEKRGDMAQSKTYGDQARNLLQSGRARKPPIVYLPKDPNA